MGSMDRRLGGSAISTTTLHYHRLRDVWRSPRGAVLRIEALALAAIALSFLVVAFGSCRRWSNSWVVQKGFLAAQVLSISFGTYSIGLMQSSPVKNEMYPIWAVSLLTLFGCVDPITTYVGLDYKGPLSKMIFQLCLYCGYVLVMSVSTIFSGNGNVAICALCAITFFKGFHRSLTLVLPSRTRDNLGTFVYPETGALAGHGQELRVLVPALRNPLDRRDTLTMGDIHLSCNYTDELGLSSVIGTSSGSGRTSIEDVCFGYALSRLLQRRFLGLGTDREMERKKERFKTLIEAGEAIDYKWALKVIEVEMAFLYEMFFTSNEFLHMHDANTASFWALASFIAICFVGVVAAIPGAMDSRHRHRMAASAHLDAGTGILVVETTTADLIVTLVILASLALLQLVQLLCWWTSNWTRVAFLIDYTSYSNWMEELPRSIPTMQPTWYMQIRLWWKRMKVRVVTKMDWFDNKYLWQDKLRQYSLVDVVASNRGCIGTRCLLEPFIFCGQLPGMLGLWHVTQVLWELLLSNTNAGVAVKLHDDVKESIAKFLGTIKSRRIGEWSSSLSLDNELAEHLPYSTTALSPHLEVEDDKITIDTVPASVNAYAFTNRVMIWHIVTCYCEQVEQLEQADGGGGRDDSDKNRRVAIALSKYCAYLVVSAPELLPGPASETRRAFDQVGRWTEEALRGREHKILPQDDWVSKQDKAFYDNVVLLGKRLLNKMTTTTTTQHTSSTDHWKVLAHVWVQTLLYAAPYGDVQAHMQHLSQGGEFITHLWALLYHLGIDSWEREGEANQPPAAAAAESSREAAAEAEEDAGESSREAAQIQTQRAQQNLSRQLGLVQDDLQPAEIDLQEFVSMFNGPLPDQVIAALAEMLSLDHDGPTMEINEALINSAGEGIADLQEEILPASP